MKRPSIQREDVAVAVALVLLIVVQAVSTQL